MAPRWLRRKRIRLLCFGLAASLAWMPHVLAQSKDVAVIVSPQNPVTNVSLSDLRKLLMGEKRTWPNGARVKLIVRPPGTHGRETMLRIMGMSESEYRQYWTAQVLRGDADAEPVVVPSFGMVKEAVKIYPGALALVDASLVKDGTDAKVIKVDGSMPGDPNYSLH